MTKYLTDIHYRPYFFIERAGRRNVLMASAGACSICMIVIAITLRIGTKFVCHLSFQPSCSTHHPLTLSNRFLQALWIFVASTFLFFDFFSLGVLPICWIYAPEVMPQRTLNKGVALGVGLHWLSNFVIVYVTPLAITRLGYRLYIIWAILNAVFVPITWLFYPETAGRTLEDMNKIFEKEKFGVTRTRTRGLCRKEETGSEEVLVVQVKTKI